MCQKLPYCARQIDPCIADLVRRINGPEFRTLASCCGHGRYLSSIVVLHRINGIVFEWFSKVELHRFYKNGHVSHRFYRQDKKGNYYIPEVINAINRLR